MAHWVGDPENSRPMGKWRWLGACWLIRVTPSQKFALLLGFPARRCISTSKRPNLPRYERHSSHEMSKFTPSPINQQSTSPPSSNTSSNPQLESTGGQTHLVNYNGALSAELSIPCAAVTIRFSAGCCSYLVCRLGSCLVEEAKSLSG